MPIDNRYVSDNGDQPVVTRTSTKIVPVEMKLVAAEPNVILTKEHEEWTTCKRIVNHKTKQVETRVQRQLILEDGRVIADSGPQVTTKTTEDVRVEETEDTQRKTTGDTPSIPGYSLVPDSVTVISEKKESNQVVTESKEERRQLHDESFRELSGEELHQRIVISPSSVGFIGTDDPSTAYPGTLTHFSSHSQKVVDKEEVKEITEMKNGEESTETTRTHHHEEAYDDEVPEDEAECEAIPEKSSEMSRTMQYYTDPTEFDALSEKLQRESLYYRGKAQNNAICHQQSHGEHPDFESGIEKSKTTSGGNKIIIEMSGNNKSTPNDPYDFNDYQTNGYSSVTKRRDRCLDNRNDQIQWIQGSNGVSTLRHHEALSNGRKHIEGKHSSSVRATSDANTLQSRALVKTFYLGENDKHSRLTLRPKLNSPSTEFTEYGSPSETVQSDRSRRNAHQNVFHTRRGNYNNYANEQETVYAKSHGKYKRPTKCDKEIQVSMSDDNTSEDERLSPNRSEQSSFLDYEPEKQCKATSSRNANRSNPFHIAYSRSESFAHPSQQYDYHTPKSHGGRYSSNAVFSPRNNNSRESLVSLPYKSLEDDFAVQNHTASRHSIKVGDRMTNDYSNSSSLSSRRSEREKYTFRGFLPQREVNSQGISDDDDDHYRKKKSTGKSKNFNVLPQKEILRKRNLPMHEMLPTPPSSTPSPRVVKVRSPDPYDSSSSLSSHEYPVRSVARDSRHRQKFSSNLRSSKSSSDLRTPKLLNSPTLYISSTHPSDTLAISSKRDSQKYFQTKSGAVQVREWRAK